MGRSLSNEQLRLVSIQRSIGTVRAIALGDIHKGLTACGLNWFR